MTVFVFHYYESDETNAHAGEPSYNNERPVTRLYRCTSSFLLPLFLTSALWSTVDASYSVKLDSKLEICVEMVFDDLD